MIYYTRELKSEIVACDACYPKHANNKQWQRWTEKEGVERVQFDTKYARGETIAKAVCGTWCTYCARYLNPGDEITDQKAGE